MSVNPDVDRMVADAVRTIRDRFGVIGLRDLVAVATTELRRAENESAQLTEDPGVTDMGDTQAWMAFTGDELDRH